MKDIKIVKSLKLLFVLLLLLTFYTLNQRVDAATLDGSIYNGEMGEKGKTKGDKETIEFKDGKFHSAACDPHGFTAASYTSETKNGVTTFRSETISPKEGKMDWEGTVKGNMIDANATWHKQGQPDKQFWVKGELKK